MRRTALMWLLLVSVGCSNGLDTGPREFGGKGRGWGDVEFVEAGTWRIMDSGLSLATGVDVRIGFTAKLRNHRDEPRMLEKGDAKFILKDTFGIPISEIETDRAFALEANQTKDVSHTFWLRVSSGDLLNDDVEFDIVGTWVNITAREKLRRYKGGGTHRERGVE